MKNLGEGMKFKVVNIVIAILMITGCSVKHSKEPSAKDNLSAKNITLQLDRYTNKRVGNDCSGFVMLVNRNLNNIYFTEKQIHKNIDKSGRLSQAMFNLYKKQNQITTSSPRVGDLIFFKNTTQKTKNSKNQNITHVGIIREVYSDGRVKFIHNSNKKNVVSFMNLNRKNTISAGKKIHNDFILRCKKNNLSCLASNRFVGFGRVKD